MSDSVSHWEISALRSQQLRSASLTIKPAPARYTSPLATGGIQFAYQDGSYGAAFCDAARAIDLLHRSRMRIATGFVTGDRTNNSVGDQREGNIDRWIAACLLDKNKAEVELGKIAAEHANNKDVKKFAEKMIEDHSQVVEKLNDSRAPMNRTIADLKSSIKLASGVWPI